MARQRLDQYLVTHGHFQTRARARDAVLRGCVMVGGLLAEKPSVHVGDGAQVEIADPAQAYVSRAALKLVHGFDTFEIDVQDAICVDIGASTGGFTQVLIERGARHVFAVDVGHDQLAKPLRDDPRVTNLERLNARVLSSNHLDALQPDIVVSDVSFISLKLALPPALGLAKHGARCVLLVKPQFEVGRERIGKGGLVDAQTAKACADAMRDWLDGLGGWRATGVAPSPIKGGDGNQEYLLAGIKING
ncbi:MAG: TlyA family RNA methyltransferase [Pseudomonadota bacterium]